MNENDIYPGEGAGGELLAFSVREWTVMQQHLSLFDTLADVYCQEEGLKVTKTGNYRGYWPQRGVVGRRWGRKYCLEVSLNNALWLKGKGIVWNLRIYSEFSMAMGWIYRSHVFVQACLSTSDMSDCHTLDSYFQQYEGIMKSGDG